MKPLPEENKIFEILDKLKQIMPELKIPSVEEIYFHESPNIAGWGGDKYGISIRVRESAGDIVALLIHELVHYNGIMGHGQKFEDMYEKIINRYLEVK